MKLANMHEGEKCECPSLLVHSSFFKEKNVGNADAHVIMNAAHVTVGTSTSSVGGYSGEGRADG